MNIVLPAAVWPFVRYALVVSETKVSMVSWHRGKMTKICEYVNDNQGLHDFALYLKKNGKLYNNKSVNVSINVVGEDYRFEKVAHLVGKYKTDMLKRRFEQLFRGTTYHMALAQGREAIGRRQDYYLFCGILSNEKVQPWVKELIRFNMNIAGVHLGSMLAADLFKHIVATKGGVNVISICLEDGNIRHNFFIDGNIRFSRLSRGSENQQSEEMFRSVRGEIEKTSQYLASVKLIPNNAKIAAYIVCAEDLQEDLKSLAASSVGERVSVNAVSARLLAGVIGIKRPITEFGRDSSLICHQMLRSMRFNQLAPLAQIRYSLLEACGGLVGAGALLWALSNVFLFGTQLLGSYNQFSSHNEELQANIRQLSNDYKNLVNEFVQPPSTTENMQASVNVLNHVSEINLTPGKMLLFLSKQMENSPAVQITEVEWLTSNEPSTTSRDLYAFANGRKYYEILKVIGELDINYNSEKAFNQYTRMVKKIDSRPDMTVVEVQRPSLVEAGGNLVGTLGDNTDIRSQLNAYTENSYEMLITWDPTALAGDEV